MSEILARPFSRNNHLRKPDYMNIVAAKQHGIWRDNITAQAEHETTFYSLVSAPETQKSVCLLCIRELQCTMLSKGEFELRFNGYFEKVQNPFSDLPRPGTVQINDKAQVFGHDLDLFVTVQLLDEPPAILLLHKLCSNADVHMSGKRRNSTMGPKWEDNYTKNGQLSTCRCFNIVIIFQQHFVFNIEMKGSV